jgi:hypothetical protein
MCKDPRVRGKSVDGIGEIRRLKTALNYKIERKKPRLSSKEDSLAIQALACLNVNQWRMDYFVMNEPNFRSLVIYLIS